MEVRSAVVSEVGALAALHRATVTDAYADIFPAGAAPPSIAELAGVYDRLVGRTATGPEHLWVAVGANGSVHGSIALVIDADVPSGHRIERFNVRPTSQNRGIGRLLYDAAIAHARTEGLATLNLWVLEDNTRARAIYERWGWTRIPGRTLENTPPEILDVLYELTL